MSGTASLSAAKNRRSGNEVKFNGQQKQPMPPPPQSPSQPYFRPGSQPAMQQKNTQQNTQQNMQQKPNSTFKPLPHPLVLLKSHELRLQKLEKTDSTSVDSGQTSKDCLVHTEDLNLLKKEYALIKQEQASAKNAPNDKVNQLETVVQTHMKKISQLESQIVTMATKMKELYLLVNKISPKGKTKTGSSIPVEDQPICASTTPEEPNITFAVVEP